MTRQQMITALCQRYKDDNGLFSDSPHLEMYIGECHDMNNAELKEEYEQVFSED